MNRKRHQFGIRYYKREGRAFIVVPESAVILRGDVPVLVREHPMGILLMMGAGVGRMRWEQSYFVCSVPKDVLARLDPKRTHPIDGIPMGPNRWILPIKKKGA